MVKTMECSELLLATDVSQRDAQWEAKFLKLLPDLPVNALHPEPRQGPDNWPYLMVASDQGADDSVRNVVTWLSNKGIGLAVNPGKAAPDYVLSYGMIWNFRERGEFLTDIPEVKPGQFTIAPGQQLWTGAPSEAYLPSYVRNVIKQFLADQAVFAPRILMVNFQGSSPSLSSLDGDRNEASFDLCFSIESLNSPPEQEHENIAEALSWFLPAHYSISLVSETTIPGFGSL